MFTKEKERFYCCVWDIKCFSLKKIFSEKHLVPLSALHHFSKIHKWDIETERSLRADIYQSTVLVTTLEGKISACKLFSFSISDLWIFEKSCKAESGTRIFFDEKHLISQTQE